MRKRSNLCFNLFWVCNVNFLSILITCHWIVCCKSLPVVAGRVQGILLGGLYSSMTVLHIHFFLHVPLFPVQFLHCVMWYSGHPLLRKGITNMTCMLASTWVWGKWKYRWQGTHRGFFLIVPGKTTHFNEECALYFTLYHASKRKPPWACQAQEVIWFRAVCGNCLSKIFSVLMTTSCYCWCLWRVYNFLFLQAKMRKSDWRL